MPASSNRRVPEPISLTISLSAWSALIGLALAAPESWRHQWAFVSTLAFVGVMAAGATYVAVRAWGITYLGWRPFPTHEERKQRKEERELRERRAVQSRRQMLERAMDNLGDAARVISEELREERLFGFNGP